MKKTRIEYSTRFTIMILATLFAAIVLYNVWSKMLPNPTHESMVYTKITNVLSNQAQMPLIDYCIKASYNSAFDGKRITIDALNNVLQRGCRFLDFEIFFVDSVPVVGVSLDPQYKILISQNTLPLHQIINYIVTHGFTENTNPKDPLFVQLRVKANCSINNRNNKICDVYQELTTILKQTTSMLYMNDTNTVAKTVNGMTKLSSIMGKLVVCIDTSLSPDYASYSPLLPNYINAEIGNTDWTVYKYSDFLTMKSNILTVRSAEPMTAEPERGVLTLKCARPDSKPNVNNPDAPFSWLRNFGCQIIFCQFYNSPVDKYEAMFDHFKTAFVPIGYVVNYVNSA